MINTNSKNTKFFLAIQNQSNSLKAISLSLDTCILSNDIPCLQPNNYDDIVAQVSQHPTNPSIIGLQNCSTNNWLVKLPNGETTNLATGKTVKLENQTHISFGEVRAAILDDVSFYRILSTGVLPSDNLEKFASNKYQTSTAKKLESDNPEKKNKTKLFAFTSIIGVAILAIGGYFIYPFIVKPSPQTSNISTNQLTTNQPQAPEDTEKADTDKTSSITSQPYKPTTSTPNLLSTESPTPTPSVSPPTKTSESEFTPYKSHASIASLDKVAGEYIVVLDPKVLADAEKEGVKSVKGTWTIKSEGTFEATLKVVSTKDEVHEIKTAGKISIKDGKVVSQVESVNGDKPPTYPPEQPYTLSADGKELQADGQPVKLVKQ